MKPEYIQLYIDVNNNAKSTKEALDAMEMYFKGRRLSDARYGDRKPYEEAYNEMVKDAPMRSADLINNGTRSQNLINAIHERVQEGMGHESWKKAKTEWEERYNAWSKVKEQASLGSREESWKQRVDDKLNSEMWLANTGRSLKGLNPLNVFKTKTGGKSKRKVSQINKKDVLGKQRRVYKFVGNRKEYIKYKNKYVLLKKYKEMQKTKTKPKTKSKSKSKK